MSAPGANGKAQTFDLEAAAAAAAAEAEAVPFAFTYKGKVYEVPPAGDWSIAALRKVSQGDLEDALSELLGPKAFDEMTAAGLNVRELNTLFDNVARGQGLGSLPNSVGPRRRASTRR